MYFKSIVITPDVNFPWPLFCASLLLVVITGAFVYGVFRYSRRHHASWVTWLLTAFAGVSLIINSGAALCLVTSYSLAAKPTRTERQLDALKSQLALQPLFYTANDTGLTGDIQLQCGHLYCTAHLKPSKRGADTYDVFITKTSRTPIITQA